MTKYDVLEQTCSISRFQPTVYHKCNAELAFVHDDLHALLSLQIRMNLSKSIPKIIDNRFK